VAELLAGPLLAGQQRLCPRRRWLQIGTFDDGGPVLVAAIERDLSQHHAAALERARQQIMHAIDSRYPGSDGARYGT
jgi:hypothetical protein